MASLDDAALLFKWRTDPHTRSQSLSQQDISWEQHLSWLTETLQNKNRRILIALHNNAPVGTIRMDDSGLQTVELSWTVSPDARGRGFGHMILAQVCLDHPQLCLAATIRAQNAASIAMARSCGFIPVPNEQSADITRWQRPAQMETKT